MADKVGSFDKKIGFYEPTKTIGTEGEVKINFTFKFNAFASIDRTAREQNADNNLNQNIDLILKTYKRSSVTTRWRVLLGNTYYEIISIDQDERLSTMMTLSLQAL